MLDLREYFKEKLNREDKYFYHRTEYRVKRRSFRSIYALSLKCASLFKELGIKKGDRVVIRGKNSCEWVIAFLGCINIGAVVVPIDHKASEDFFERVKNRVKPSIVLIEKKPEEADNDQKEVISLGKITDLCEDQQPLDASGMDISEDDTAEIIFTSGTTSRPKGVILTYRNIQANLESAIPVINKWKGILKFTVRPKALSLVPLSHMYGQVVGIFMPLISEISVMFSDSLLPKDILNTIKEEKIWVLTALPKILEVLRDHIVHSFGLDNKSFQKKYKRMRNKRWWIRIFFFLPLHLRIGWRLVAIISGGAKIDSDVDDFYRCLSYAVFQGYGLTETAPLLTLTDPARNKQGSVGSFLEDKQVKIVNGEIYVKGDNVTPGYYKDKESTKKAFEDGWFRTGDMVEVDKNGNVFFKGRQDDLIVREDGINIYPEDIENEFKKKEDINDCAVIGLKEDKRLKIIAVLLPEGKGKSRSYYEDIVDKVNKRLNIYQRVDDYYIWPDNDFPRTPTLKVKKPAILERLSVKEKKIPSEKDMQGTKDIYSILGSFKGKNVKKDPDYELGGDLGLDSMDIISLSTELEEKLGVDPENISISPDMKIGEIEKAIENPPEKRPALPFYSFTFNYIFIFLRSVFQMLLFPFIRMLYRSELSGKDNLFKSGRPYVIASNHVSIMDSLVVLYSLPFKIRAKTCVVMSIAHHFSNFFLHKGNIFRRFIEALGFFLLAVLFINIIPLSRSYGFKKVFKNIGNAADRGWNILIFPEGAVTSDGSIKRFEHGIGIILKEMGLTVIPLRIDGLFNILRNGLLPWGHLPRLPKVRVSIGDPVKTVEGDYAEIAAKIENRVREL